MSYVDEWLRRVTAPTISKGHIQMLYQHVYPMAVLPAPRRGHFGRRTSLTQGQCEQIVAALVQRVDQDGGPEVEEAQYNQGANWLHRYGKRLGIPERFWTEWPLRFHFAGCRHRESGQYGYFLPLYVAVYADGTQLRYLAQAWQSGKDFEFYVAEPKEIA